MRSRLVVVPTRRPQRLPLPVTLVAALASFAGAGGAAAQTVIATVPMTLSPHSVVVDSVRNLLFIGQADSFGRGVAEVVVIDGESNTVLTAIPVSGPVGQTGLAANEVTGRVYASVPLGLEVIDADALTLTSFIPLSSVTGVVGVNPVTNRIYATGPSTTLQVIDGGTEAVVASISLPQIPSDLEVDPLRNEVYVALSPFGFAIVDGVTNTLVTTVPISPLTLDVGVDPDLGRAYFTPRGTTAPATLFVVDTETLATLATIAVGPRTEGIGVDTSTHRIYTGSGSVFPTRGVTVVDGTSLSVVSFVPTSEPVGRPAGLNSATHRIYIPNGRPEPGGAVVVLEDLPPILNVLIDIKPGSFPNSVNLRSAGVIPVAILSTTGFSAPGEVDPGTITLAGARVRQVGKSGKLLCHDEDTNGDGLLDLVCQVETAELMLEEGESLVVLEATTFTGTAVRGEDSIQVVPNHE